MEERKTSLFWLLLGIGLVSILVITTPESEAGIFSGFIPPTPSFSIFNITGDSITAGVYNDFIELIAGAGMSISINDITHEITFTNTASGGNVVGEGVQGRLAIWNDTTKINSTANLTYDFNSNIFNIANGHFFNSSHYNIGTSRILGSMTCVDGNIQEYQASNNTWICGVDDGTGGEANTASNIGTDTGIFKSKVGVDLQFKSIRAGNNIVFTNYDDEILINATSGSSLKVDNQTAQNDFQIVGINNVTGDITTNQFSVNTETCGGTDKVSAIDNVTGYVICSADVSGGSTLKVDNQTVQNDFQIVGINNSTGVITTNQFSVNNQTCSSGFVSQINNVTGEVVCATDSSGVTTLDGLTDVTITAVVGNHILQFNENVNQWINKLFRINNQTVQNDFQIVGINNETGVITTNQFSVNTNTCSGTDKVSSIDNVTGYVTCTTDTSGSSTLKVDNQTATQGTFIIGINNETGDLTTQTFKVDNKTNVLGNFVNGINNVTGTISSQTFKADTDLNTTNNNNDSFITGYDNQTGDMTRKIFNAATTTCSSTDKFSAYDNQTGVITCSADQTGSGGGGIPKPPQKKFGALMPLTALGTTGIDRMGLLAGVPTLDGTETFQYNTTHNANAIRSISGVTAGDNAGVFWAATDWDHYRGDQNSYMYAKWVTGAITLNRLFIGFQSGTTAMPNANDAICVGVSCVGLCVNSTSTVYNLCYNAAGTTRYTSFAVSEAAFTVHYVEIYTTDSGVTWCGKMDGGTAVCSTTNIPAVTTRLRANVNTETSTANNAAVIWYYHVYTENDR